MVHTEVVGGECRKLSTLGWNLLVVVEKLIIFYSPFSFLSTKYNKTVENRVKFRNDHLPQPLSLVTHVRCKMTSEFVVM